MNKCTHWMRKLTPAFSTLCSVGIVLPVSVAQAVQPALAQDGGLMLEEVVVTARKKAETLQDVPMSVSALSSDILENKGFVDLSAIGELTPGLYFEAFDPSRPLIYVRGIGTRAYDAGSDPSVGVFVDGAYNGRFGSLNMNLLDVERIEVLKGPQGTLYGRNTIGGAISVITKDPADSLEIDLSGEIGGSTESGDDIWSASAAVSTPLVEDKLSMRLAAAVYERDGFVAVEPAGVQTGGLESLDVRAKFLWTPTDSLQARLTLDYSDVDFPPISFVKNDLGGTAPDPGPLAPGVVSLPGSGEPYRAFGNRSDIDLDRESLAATLKLDWQLENLDVTSITSVRSMELEELNELDGSEVDYSTNPIEEDSDTFSQEFRLAGDAGDVSWLLGVYYHKEKIDRVDKIIFGDDALFAFLFGIPPEWGFGIDVDAESYAAFGQADWDITDRLSMTLGLRYSRDEKDADYDTTSNLGLVVTPFKTTVGDDWSSTDGSLSLSYDFADNIMGYISYSTGYKPGGFQFGAIAPIIAEQVFEPEEVAQIELGVKAALFEQRLMVNAAIFDMDYQDLQLLRVLPAGIPGVTLVTISNAGESTIQGAELEGSALLTEGLFLDFGLSYLDAEFDEYFFDPQAGIDFSGNTLPRAPEYSYTLSLRYETSLGRGDLSSSLSYNWQDESYFEADNNQIDPDSTQDSHGLLNASISYAAESWTFTLWGTNLLDEEYRRSVLNETGQSQRQVFAAPATAGVKVNYRFR